MNTNHTPSISHAFPQVCSPPPRDVSRFDLVALQFSHEGGGATGGEQGGRGSSPFSPFSPFPFSLSRASPSHRSGDSGKGGIACKDSGPAAQTWGAPPLFLPTPLSLGGHSTHPPPLPTHFFSQRLPIFHLCRLSRRGKQVLRPLHCRGRH